MHYIKFEKITSPSNKKIFFLPVLHALYIELRFHLCKPTVDLFMGLMTNASLPQATFEQVLSSFKKAVSAVAKNAEPDFTTGFGQLTEPVDEQTEETVEPVVQVDEPDRRPFAIVEVLNARGRPREPRTSFFKKAVPPSTLLVLPAPSTQDILPSTLTQANDEPIPSAQGAKRGRKPYTAE